MLAGEITHFDAADGLGTVRLDDGREIRFSLTVCGYLRPEIGLRVRVLSLTPGFGGQLKATLLEPEVTGTET